MSQTPSEKFLYFTVGLLKGSPALDALRQDATKHHMVDQPGQLIALRLTEYYEMMNQGIVQPVVKIPAVILPHEAEATKQREQISSPFGEGQAQGKGANQVSTPTIPGRIETHEPQQSVSPSLQPSQPSARVQLPSDHSQDASSSGNGGINPVRQFTGRMRAVRRENSGIISVSPAAEKNADEAADYWSPL